MLILNSMICGDFPWKKVFRVERFDNAPNKLISKEERDIKFPHWSNSDLYAINGVLDLPGKYILRVFYKESYLNDKIPFYVDYDYTYQENRDSDFMEIENYLSKGHEMQKIKMKTGDKVKYIGPDNWIIKGEKVGPYGAKCVISIPPGTEGFCGESRDSFSFVQFKNVYCEVHTDKLEVIV